MPCTHCPHCRAADLSSQLVLPSRPAAGAVPDSNRGFYRAFGRIYDLARPAGNAKQLMLDANPWMTPSQYREYLRRARAFGFVGTPARLQPEPVVGAPAPVPHPAPAGLDDGMARWLADARATFPGA